MDKYNEFMTKIIGDICSYAVLNGMEPDNTLENVANSILSLLEIVTFNNWMAEEKRDG